MEDIYKKYLGKLNMNSPSTTNINAIENTLGICFPADYVEFMQKENGGEGEIANSYIIFWSLEDLAELNEAYAVKEFAPGLVIFGSNGGDTAYAFNTNSVGSKIVEVPFIGMDIRYLKNCANSFIEFIEYLSKK
jgi:hypothetical protein